MRRIDAPFRRLLTLLTAIALATAFAPAAWAARPDGGAILPVIFVHGQSGSAQQFETQAMRFTSNYYPQRLLFAFEYDTSPNQPNPLADLDAFIDAVLAETGADQVQAVGHSRGTSVWTEYLEDPGFDGPSKVARYVNIDGRSPAELPGGVPTIGIWGEWNTAGSGFNRRGDTDAQIGPDPDDNYYFAAKSHTEVATSPEAFALMFEFFAGRPPFTTDVRPEPPGKVTVAGRAVIFPENIGFDGATVEVWKVDGATGQRIGGAPQEVWPIDESGDFGPVPVSPQSHYEFAVLRPANDVIPIDTVHHFYTEPFIRSDHFFRLQTSRPGGSIEAFIPRSDEATGFVITRQREYWGDQGADSDMLLIDGLNIATPEIAPRAGVNLAVFAFDDGLDGMTDLGKGELFPFGFITFLTAGDVFTPSSPDASGTVVLTDVARGSGDVSVVNVPNWPGLANRVTVQFRDDE